MYVFSHILIHVNDIIIIKPVQLKLYNDASIKKYKSISLFTKVCLMHTNS